MSLRDVGPLGPRSERRAHRTQAAPPHTLLGAVGLRPEGTGHALRGGDLSCPLPVEYLRWAQGPRRGHQQGRLATMTWTQVLRVPREPHTWLQGGSIRLNRAGQTPSFHDNLQILGPPAPLP